MLSVKTIGPNKAITPELIEYVQREVAKYPKEQHQMAALEILLDLIPNDADFIQAFFKIRTKKDGIVPFRFNRAQNYLEDTVTRLKAEKKRILLIVLKYRQGGVSTWTQAHLLMNILRKKHSSALVIADSMDNSEWLFNIGKRMFESLPFLPPVKYSGRGEIILEDVLGSDYSVETAHNIHAGRAKTIHNLHASEVSFWNQPDLTMSGLSQAMADDPSYWIVFESTANGLGGYFYEKWKSSLAGENDFTPVFLPLHMSDEYRRSADSPEARAILAGYTDEEEKILLDQHKIDIEVLAWRRWAIQNKCDGNLDLFHQEYPMTWQESFLVSGRGAFPTQILEGMLLSAPQPIFEGDIDILRGGRHVAATER